MTVHRDGMACGLSQWPDARISVGPVNATMDGTLPKYLPKVLTQYRQAGMRLVCVFPRARVTTNGQTKGPYSVAKAKKLVDEYLSYLPPAKLLDYATDHTLLGFSAGDDFSNPDVWGGEAVTPGMAYDVVSYAKEQFGKEVPVGLRQTPAWISGSSALSSIVDFGWAQWLAARGDAQTFYDKAWKIASARGFNMAAGVNAHSCVKAGYDSPCSPDTLWRVLSLALNHPGVRASVSWRYDGEDWKKTGPTWGRLAELAATRPKRSLLRGTP